MHQVLDQELTANFLTTILLMKFIVFMLLKFLILLKGCAITSNKSIHKLLIAARNFGQFEKQTNDIIIPGLNSKMNELSAIVGNYNLKNFNKLIVKRKK